MAHQDKSVTATPHSLTGCIPEENVITKAPQRKKRILQPSLSAILVELLKQTEDYDWPSDETHHRVCENLLHWRRYDGNEFLKKFSLYYPEIPTEILEAANYLGGLAEPTATPPDLAPLWPTSFTDRATAQVSALAHVIDSTTALDWPSDYVCYWYCKSLLRWRAACPTQDNFVSYCSNYPMELLNAVGVAYEKFTPTYDEPLQSPPKWFRRSRLSKELAHRLIP